MGQQKNCIRDIHQPLVYTSVKKVKGLDFSKRRLLPFHTGLAISRNAPDSIYQINYTAMISFAQLLKAYIPKCIMMSYGHPFCFVMPSSLQTDNQTTTLYFTFN